MKHNDSNKILPNQVTSENYSSFEVPSSSQQSGSIISSIDTIQKTFEDLRCLYTSLTLTVSWSVYFWLGHSHCKWSSRLLDYRWDSFEWWAFHISSCKAATYVIVYFFIKMTSPNQKKTSMIHPNLREPLPGPGLARRGDSPPRRRQPVDMVGSSGSYKNTTPTTPPTTPSSNHFIHIWKNIQTV